MCVSSTAKRRRRQMKLDKRFRKRSPESSQRREEAYRAGKAAIAALGRRVGKK